MIFNGIDLSSYLRIKKIVGRGMVNSEVQLKEINGMDGALYQRKKRPPRPLGIEADIRADDEFDLRMKIDELNGILNVDEPVSIIFPDEPDIEYFGVPEQSGETEEFTFIHKGQLVIICPDPDKYGLSYSPTISENEVLTVGGTSKTYPTITAQFQTPSQTGNFEGKVSGSTVENPHIFKWRYSTILDVPNDANWSEGSQSYYDLIESQGDGTFHMSRNVVDMTSQAMFVFDVIKLVERKYKFTVPGSNTDEKVQWIRDNISNLDFKCWAYGSGPSGYGANMTIWIPSGNRWYTPERDVSTSSSSITLLQQTGFSSPSAFIDDSGYIYMLAYAEASDGTVASDLFIDYVELGVGLSTVPEFKITNGTETLRLIWNFINGDLLEIDMKKRKVIINGNVSMTAVDLTNPNFFPLLPGNNTLTITPNNVATITASYREKWA